MMPPIDQYRGAFVVEIAKTFAKFKGPNGEGFGNRFFLELQMGKLAEILKAEELELFKLRSEQAKVPVLKTPNGNVLDSDDLAAIDSKIAGTANSEIGQTSEPQPTDQQQGATIPIPKPGNP